MRIPWGLPTVSDATKLGPAKVCPPPPGLTGERLYELLHQNVLTDNFVNFDNWTKLGVYGAIRTITTKASAVSANLALDFCVRKDYGAGYFTGDFTHDFDVILESAPILSASLTLWAICAGAYRTRAQLMVANDGFAVLWYLSGANHRIQIWNYADDTTVSYDVGNATFPQTLYCRMNRTGTTATLTFYTTAARTVEVTHITLTVPSTAYRYLFGLQAEAGGTGSVSASCQNLALTAGGAPVDFNDGLWDLLYASETPNVSVSGGVVSMDGHGSYGNGLAWSKANAEGYIEVQKKAVTAYDNVMWGTAFVTFVNSWQQDNNAANLYALAPSGNAGGYAGLTAGVYYTLRIYMLKDAAGAFKRVIHTIQGGTQFPTETVIQTMVVASAIGAATWAQLLRYSASPGALTQFQAFKAFFGYPTDGPKLTFLADAGNGKLFNGLVFSSLAAVGSWLTTNVTFAYDFSDNATPSWSAEKTLAQLNALAALTTQKRYIHLRITVNSSGTVQQYSGEINADNGTDIASSPAVPAAPAGLAIAPRKDGSVKITITNMDGLNLTDQLVVYDDASDYEVGRISKAGYIATINAPPGGPSASKPANCLVLSLPKGTFILYSKTTADGTNFSAKSDTAGVTNSYTPDEADVRDGVGFGVDEEEFEGLVAVPSPGKVVEDEPIDQDVGTRQDADPDDVLQGSGNYGDPEAPLVPALLVDEPAPVDVRETATTHGYPGAIPQDDILVASGGHFYEAARNADPTEAKVLAGTGYKICNVPKTGSLPAASAPTKPLISIGSTGVTVDGDPGVTNYVYYRKDGASQGWTLLGSRSGDGIVLFGSLAEGSYLFAAQSDAAGAKSLLSDAKRYYVGGSTRTLDHRVWLDCAAALEAVAAVQPLFLDREECRVLDIVRGKVPNQRFPYIGAEWSGESNDLDVEETDYATGRLVISIVLKDEPRKGKQWDLDRWVKIVVQSLAADETRGDLVFKWRYRGTETPGGIIAPLRVARLSFEYEHAPTPAARVSV